MMEKFQEIVDEIESILENEKGLYSGWWRLSSSKYGGVYTAYAVISPPENDLEHIREPTGLHHGNDVAEAMSGLLSELREWKSRGCPYTKDEPGAIQKAWAKAEAS
jgi:hypothetical protein